jgi:hypothetical protein
LCRVPVAGCAVRPENLIDINCLPWLDAAKHSLYANPPPENFPVAGIVAGDTKEQPVLELLLLYDANENV